MIPDLTTKTTKEQAQIRGDLAFNSLAKGKFTVKGITINVTEIFKYPDGFQVTLEASSANGKLPVDNPYQFVNPPIKMGNGILPVDDVSTEEVVKATKQIIYDAVVLIAQGQGWQP